MATILQSKDIQLNLNGQPFFCSDLSLSQSADISPIYNINESVTNRNISNGPVTNSLNISYYFSGKDFLRDYIYANSDYPLSGYLAGLQFFNGHLESYSLNAAPQSLININATIKICDELSGNLNKIVPSGPPTGVTQCTSNNIIFNTSNFAAFNIENIKNFNWSYRADVEPIYFQKETGLSHINPDRVVISNKEINCTITTNTNNNNLLLPFTGDNYAIEMLVKHPTNTGIFETYGISGKINRKDFNISQNSIGESSYSITQWHLNEEPKISSIINTFLPNTGYFIISSPNLTNGYFSSNKKLPLIEKVILGGEQLKFSLNRGASTDTITGYTSNNSVNGSLEIQTSKGLIIYPTELTFNFSGIGVSGFTPQTGNYHDSILISGTNFFKISQVLFNNVPANFQIKQNTGINGFHELIASVPDNATLGKITVLSTQKNRSGISTGIFYPIPIITGFTPTGMFSGNCIIEGKNFSGITNVYFNNINSPSFTVNNNSKITATIPGTGAGYTKGFLKLSGFRGMESPLSETIYQPIIPIYNLSVLSGTIAEDIAIHTIIDTGFLCPASYGFKIGFGRITGVFVPSGTGMLTGLIPNGFFNNAPVSIFEPDGVGKYPPYTGALLQIGPAPKIENVYPSEIHQYQKYTLNLEGKYFKDFFGINTFAIISGVRTDPPSNDKYVFNAIVPGNNQVKVQITGLRITGATGYYDVNLINFVGTGRITGLKVLSGIDWASTQAAASHFPFNFVDFVNADKAIDGNNSTYSSTQEFGGSTARPSGWFTLAFQQPIDVNKIIFNHRANADNIAKTGIIQLFDNSLTEVIFTDAINWSNTGYNYLESPHTGIKSIKLYRYQPLAPSTNKTFLSWNTIQVY